MVSALIYLEGGGNRTEGNARCREGFRKLLERCGLSGRMPRLVASGSRNTAFDNFNTAHSNATGPEYVALLIDSEDRVSDIEETWEHLRRSDSWQKPRGAREDQVLLMTTCMETWIVADRTALREHFRSGSSTKCTPFADQPGKQVHERHTEQFGDRDKRLCRPLCQGSPVIRGGGKAESRYTRIPPAQLRQSPQDTR